MKLSTKREPQQKRQMLRLHEIDGKIKRKKNGAEEWGDQETKFKATVQ